MKTLQKFLGVGVAVALLGLNVVMADVMKPDSVKKPMQFSLDIGDSSFDLPDISFDAMSGVDGEEAQQTCAMTPGGVASMILELPPITMPRPEQWNNASRVALAPLGTLPSPPNDSPSRRRQPPRRSTTTPTPPPILVPEPATLVIVGLGIGAVAIARRREEIIAQR